MIMILTCAFYGLCVLPGFIYIFGSDKFPSQDYAKGIFDTQNKEYAKFKGRRYSEETYPEDREELSDSNVN